MNFRFLYLIADFVYAIVCAALLLAAVNLRAICRVCFSYGSKSNMTLPSMAFGVC